jgi:hypothetical protein
MSEIEYLDLVEGVIYIGHSTLDNSIPDKEYLFLGLRPTGTELMDGDGNITIFTIGSMQFYNPSEYVRTTPLLDISRTSHIGDKTEGVDVILIDNTNVISMNKFNNGDECVRIPGGDVKMPPNSGNNYSIFKVDTLQDWFYKSNKNPLTRDIITEDQIERFTYRKPTSGGRKKTRRYKSKKTNTRKKINKRKK